MSSNVFTYGIRGRIPQLNGADTTAALAFFRPLIGEPEDIDELDGVVNYFYYDDYASPYSKESQSRKREYQAVRNETYKQKDPGWGVQKSFHSMSDEAGPTEMLLSLEFIQDEINKMAKRFGLDPSLIIVYSYSWYNGSDEPIELDAKNPKIMIEENAE